MCNAFPPGSEPYHGWETLLRGHTTDRAGHVHKSHLYRVHRDQLPAHPDEILKRLQEADGKVAKLALALFTIHNVFRFSRAQWHKGLTISGAEDVNPEITAVELNDAEMGPHETRMLRDLYKWARGRQDFKPVLVKASAFHYRVMEQSPFLINSRDLSLTLGERKIELPRNSDGSGRIETEIWREFVRPLYIRDPSSDLRLLDPAVYAAVRSGAV